MPAVTEPPGELIKSLMSYVNRAPKYAMVRGEKSQEIQDM